MVPSQRKYDEIHAQNIERYSRQIRAAYRSIIDEITGLKNILSLNPNNEFYFRNNPEVNRVVNELIKQLDTDIYGITVEGINTEWGLAVQKNNELAAYAAGSKLAELPEAYKQKWFSSNENALKAFIKRKENGLGLSDRVWRNTRQFKTELELALEVGIKQGKSAANLSRDVRTYLNEPDKLFRRVRENQTLINEANRELNLLKEIEAPESDIARAENQIKKLREQGTLRLSKAAKAYHPGQGRYRSSYKNALRLTRNETNFSYEASNFEKRKQQDFVVGIEIKTTPGYTRAVDKGGIVCGDLEGRYPKDFDFTNKWHTNCRCLSLDILKSRDEIDNDLERILTGKEPTKTSQNLVNKKPSNYTNYLKDNSEKWANWKAKPRTFERN